MNNYVRLIVTTLCFGAFALLTSTSSAQNRAAKVEAIAQQLNLTPEQKAKILPILREEAPKVQAIKNDNSMSRMQKLQAVKAIHQQTDPQMKAILSPEQYQKLQAIRRKALSDAIHRDIPLTGCSQMKIIWIALIERVLIVSCALRWQSARDMFSANALR